MNAPSDMLLSPKQAGHLRHFGNLVRQPMNDWSLMHGRGTGQEDFGGYRFQLAYMAYALALTFRHRLPAAPGLFKPLFERLIDKMLLPDVWLYWPRVSRGGSIFNAHLAHTYQEEWNPVGKDNIMYSAYVQSMALMYDYLFDDHRYATPGALTFKYWSYFWGGEERRFEYDQNSLNDHIYWLMAESGFLGVACEPNCIFQICNQPAILGFRMHDLLNGGSVAGEVTAAYQRAWQQFGRVGDNGHYHLMISGDSHTVRPNVTKTPWADAWCGMLMNMWNRDFVHAHYPAQVRDLLRPGADGRLSVISPPAPVIMGQTVTLDSSDFGWVCAWAAEMGDHATLQGLLDHADAHMSPTWRDGGLYYPRNDEPTDADGHATMMSALGGNTLLGYARLNVPDGLWSLYNQAWDPARHSEPALVAVDDDVDVLQAVHEAADAPGAQGTDTTRDARPGTLRFRVRRAEGVKPRGGTVTIGRLLDRGPWKLRCGDRIVAQGHGNQPATGSGLALAPTPDGLRMPVPAEATGYTLTLDA